MTGTSLQIGVVFAGYENLGGKQPLDGDGEALTLDVGKVIKADITEFGYSSYDFMLTGIALRESNPFGLKWKIACLTVLKKLDNSLIACTFSPCNPTYFLI